VVNVFRKPLQRIVYISILIVPLVVAVQAEVIVRVDRADLDLNESLSLEIVVDSDVATEPDLSVLEEDFHVGQGSQLSNTTIINGRIQRSRTWTYVLMPKRVGELRIPPIAVGNDQSGPLIIVVSEPSYAPPGEADVFITGEVDYDETYVQAQVLYTVKIYRAVATRQPALRDPSISGAEVLVELAGDDRNYEAIIDGRAYSVVERVIALYPQESGEITISPARFEARVLKDGRISGRKVYESDAKTITVMPVPTPPMDFPGANWLPARNLELSEDWSRDPGELAAGEPVTRHITISALGQLETQIPAIDLPIVDGVNIYQDKPELSRHFETGGIRGVRSDQYAMIGVAPGSIRLPALEVPWWDIDADEWQVARLPERVINILGSGEPAPMQPTSTVTPEFPGNESLDVAVPQGHSWRRISQILLALWLITVFGWWWTSRPTQADKPPATVPLHKRQARFLKAARRAALAGDSAAARAAILDWGRLQWPDEAPRSVATIARRVSSPLADELDCLSRHSYGPAGANWNGEKLARALRSFAVLADEARGRKELLPPLMPSG
jgi:hypothetical protein